MGRLDGRVVIVTGAARGIGRAIALACGAEGAAVCVSSRSGSTAQLVADEITAAGGAAFANECDVGSRAAVDAMVADTIERHGRVDALFNNAQAFGTAAAPSGSPGYVPLEQFPEDAWDFTFQTGLKGTLYAMQAVFPHMVAAGGGKIVNFGSGNSLGAMPGTAAYNANKEAIRSLTRTGAAEWGKHAITVNVVVPQIATDSAQEFLAARPGIGDKLLKQIPLRRWGDVDHDIGGVAVFLASTDSDYITGQTLQVDGGQILRP
jgi:NAD(P)-dependent dehydrogenase (short-subunit alcohol dehydrogenase family)